MSDNPPMTEDQVQRFLERINFPSSRSSSPFISNYQNLCILVACHLSYIPWENVTLQYSKDYLMLLEKNSNFENLITRKRGGPCPETVPSFARLLQTLGYEVYMVLARVWLDDTIGCPASTHVVLIVTLNNVEYLVDIGLPHDGLTAPLPIFNGAVIDTPMNGVIPAQNRIQMTEIPESRRKNHKVWTLQHRSSPDAVWEKLYTFEKDAEAFDEDMELIMAKMYVPGTIWGHILVCSRVKYNDNWEAVSRLILGNDLLIEESGGKKKLLARVVSEEQRTRILEEEFGIKLTPEELKRKMRTYQPKI